MTIKRGEPWGRLVDRPDRVRTARDDAEVAEMLAVVDDVPLLVTGGDLARTLGVGPTRTGGTVRELPIDLLEVRLDDGPTSMAVAHVVAHRRPGRGGCWRGEVIAAMNAEFYGDFDVAPRGHPNDGRVELVRVDPSMSLRARRAARRRLPSGGHLPHPDITTRSLRSAVVDFQRPLEVRIDHRLVGTASRLELEVRADAATVLV